MKKMVFLAAVSLLAAYSPAMTWDLSKESISITVESDLDRIDLARDFTLSVTATFPKGVKAALPDLRDRFQGFRVAEDFEEDPAVSPDGSTTLVSRWRLVPESAAARYRLAPFAVADRFWTSPIVFEPPDARESVTGPMEISPRPDPPPLDLRRLCIYAAVLALCAAALWVVAFVVRRIRRMIRVHRMSPIERARYELDVLLGKGLPGKGLYKDFYVELTMVVRRYIGRRHGIKAPQLTTDEFLRDAAESGLFDRETIELLKTFLESADLVKFAGLDATPEMADDATSRARDYLESDNAAMASKGR